MKNQVMRKVKFWKEGKARKKIYRKKYGAVGE